MFQREGAHADAENSSFGLGIAVRSRAFVEPYRFLHAGCTVACNNCHCQYHTTVDYYKCILIVL